MLLTGVQRPLHRQCELDVSANQGATDHGYTFYLRRAEPKTRHVQYKIRPVQVRIRLWFRAILQRGS